MRIKASFLLVDGYNIIFAWDDLAKLTEVSLEAARDKLVEIMINFGAVISERIIVVFDAYKVAGGVGSVTRRGDVTVIFTKESETADAYIEKTSHELSREFSVRVASSDALEQVIILSQGAIRVSAQELRREVAAAAERVRERINAMRPIKSNVLISNLDKQAIDWLERKRLDNGR